MSYCDFRMKVLQSYQTKLSIEDKFFLVHNHFISAKDGVATLSRHVDEYNTEEDSDDIDDRDKDKHTTTQDPDKKRRKTVSGV